MDNYVKNMAHVICTRIIPCSSCPEYDFGRCYFLGWCEKLYNAGYREIPKGSVVLSKEEWEEIKIYKSYILELKKAFDKIRNQAVKEVLERLKSNCVANGKKNPLMGARVTEYEIDEIAKEFGVEIKE